MNKYAVIGNPVQHSLSPQLHQCFAAQAGIELEYTKIEAPLNDFATTLQAFIQQGGVGCNITVPFKTEAYRLADKLGDNAKNAKAANCLAVQEDGSLFGDNFDGVGLVQDITENHQYNLNQRQILIIGAGGATRGILAPLMEKAPDEIIITNRTVEKAQTLANEFQAFGPICGIALEELAEYRFDLIIHATSLGYQNKTPPLPDNILTDETFCYDLSYGAAAQPFLSWAKKLGAQRLADGIGMLVEQAAASFYLWHGVYPDTQAVFQAGLPGISPGTL